MARFSTTSWQARRALAFREPFETHGSFNAVDGGSPWNTGRLPREWSQRYSDAARDNRVVYTVFSYSTPIAWVLDDKITGEVVQPPVKYSVTTSKHQSMLYALTADRETRASIDDAADRERQNRRDRRNDQVYGGVVPFQPVHPYRQSDIQAAEVLTRAEVLREVTAQAVESALSDPQRVMRAMGWGPGINPLSAPPVAITGQSAAEVATSLRAVDLGDRFRADQNSAYTVGTESWEVRQLTRRGYIENPDGIWELMPARQNTQHVEPVGNSYTLAYSEEWNARHGNTTEGDWRNED